MAVEEKPGEGAPRHGGRPAQAFLDALNHLRAHPRHRLGIEAGMSQRQLQQMHRQGAFSLRVTTEITISSRSTLARS